MSIYSTSTSGIFIGWANTGSVGTLIPGVPSELYIKAYISTSTVDVKYKLSGGTLPNNISLDSFGLITGTPTVNTGTSTLITTSNFSVSVVDNNNNQLTTGLFSVNVNQSTSTEYTNLYFKPLLTKDNRLKYQNFINNSKIFEPDSIYRYSDNNFGVIKNLQCVLDFGTEVSIIREYAYSIYNNFYKRRYILSTPKVAVSKDTSGKIIYEIIYLDILDNNINSDGISMPNRFVHNGIVYYPSSIQTMRFRINDRFNVTDISEPAFTNTVQDGDSTPLGYIAFIPICFTLPGKSKKIIRNITNSGFSFNNINFEIDRLYIQNTQDSEGTKYLLLNRNTGLV
jgi:hypothetical protein